jgi:hypothetical protein
MGFFAFAGVGCAEPLENLTTDDATPRSITLP